MTKLEQVRALFVPGETVVCTDNTYHRMHGDPNGYIGRVWTVGTVGKSVWSPADDGNNFRGTFPTRAGDVLAVDDVSATWLLGRVHPETGEPHTVTYAKAVR
jgi:hypothetical protein